MPNPISLRKKEPTPVCCFGLGYHPIFNKNIYNHALMSYDPFLSTAQFWKWIFWLYIVFYKFVFLKKLQIKHTKIFTKLANLMLSLIYIYIFLLFIILVLNDVSMNTIETIKLVLLLFNRKCDYCILTTSNKFSTSNPHYLLNLCS